MEQRIKKLEQLLLNDRFASSNDIHLVSIGKGEATAEMTVTEKHLNGVNIIQGGALFTLADFAFAGSVPILMEELPLQPMRRLTFSKEYLPES